MPADKPLGTKHAATIGLRRGERAEIEAALGRHNWNQSAAAQDLRIDRKTLRNKIERFRLEPTAGMPASVPLPPDPLDNEISLANFRRQCRIWGAKRLFEALDRDWRKYRGIQRVKLIELAVNHGYPKLPQAVEGTITVQSSPDERMARIVGLLEVARQRSLTDGNGSEGHEDGQERVSQLGDGEEDGLK